jgi:GT2 family glycosyltransferase
MSNTRNVNIKLNIIIVSYNSADTILKAIESVHTLMQEGYICLTVVDNHGNDGVAQLLRQKYSWIKVLDRSQNLGFGSGCNTGFKAQSSEYSLFLNPDAVIEPKSIQVLIDFLDDHPNTAATAPAILECGDLQLAGLLPVPIIQYKKTGTKFAVKEIQPGEDAFKTSWLCGAVLMVRSDYFEAVGGFDENFFLYFEETDLCKRFTEHGFELWANGQAVAEHIGGGSVKKGSVLMVSGCIAEHYYRSRYYYFRKHYGLFVAVTHEIVDFVLLTLKAVKAKLKGKKDAFAAFKVRIQSPFFSKSK